MSERTSYTVVVISKKMSFPMAELIFETINANAPFELPDTLNEHNINCTATEMVNNEEEITFINGHSLRVHINEVSCGYRSDVSSALKDALTEQDPHVEIEVIEYCPYTDEFPTSMDTILNGKLHSGIECAIDGTPVVPISELIKHQKNGTLDTFIQQLDARLGQFDTPSLSEIV